MNVSSQALQSILTGIGVRPSRQMGQNFLCDEGVARWITDQLSLRPGDTVIEVGPGTGALTEHLAGRVRRLLLVEKDNRLAGYLAGRFRGNEVEIINRDAVGMDLRPLYPWQPVKLVGNLPYSAGGEIIRTFLSAPTPVSSAVIMLQKEVANRVCSEPGRKSYGVLSLRVQSQWIPRIVRTLGPDLFYPRPEIDSAVVLLEPRPADSLPPYDAALFDRLVRQGFSQRRKQLKNLLPGAGERWPEIIARLGMPGSVRAEELSLPQWITLTNALDPDAPPLVDDTGDDVFDVVDGEDQVTGQARRAEVHERRLLHRAVHLLVFNRKGELFLQKRSHLKDNHPGRWDSSASGHLDSGESYLEAARREMREELDLSDGELKPVAKIPACEETDWEFVQLYRVDLEGKAQMRLAPAEIEIGDFFPLEVIREWSRARPEDFAPAFLRCLGAAARSEVEG